MDRSVNSGGQVGICSPAVLKALHESNQPVNTPIITTCNGMAATIEVLSDQQPVRISVLPRANADKTITLYIDWLTQPPASAGTNSPALVSMEIKTTRRVEDGQSIIMGGSGISESGGKILVVTASVIADNQTSK